MAPKMADQFSTLRRDVKDVQRALADIQRRLSNAQLDSVLEPPPRVDVDRRWSPKDNRRDADSTAAELGRLAEGRPFVPDTSLAVSSTARDGQVRRQNATDEDAQVAGTCDPAATDEDAGAVFTLCL